MGLIHVVLFQFKFSARPEDVDNVSQRMLALKNDCLHPSTQRSYIKSLTGGTNNSPEGISNGFTHAFVVEFESIEDRDFYVNDDPVHEDFKKLAGTVLEKAQVIDYLDGVFKL